MRADQIREQYLSFFEERGHLRVDETARIAQVPDGEANGSEDEGAKQDQREDVRITRNEQRKQQPNQQPDDERRKEGTHAVVSNAVQIGGRWDVNDGRIGRWHRLGRNHDWFGLGVRCCGGARHGDSSMVAAVSAIVRRDHAGPIAVQGSAWHNDECGG